MLMALPAATEGTIDEIAMFAAGTDIDLPDTIEGAFGAIAISASGTSTSVDVTNAGSWA